MKFLLVVSLVILCVSAAPKSRSKRFAGLGLSTAGIGGATGCVVTGNVLYANGFKQRELTSSEVDELNNYQTKLQEYKTKLKAALENRRETLKKRIQGGEMTKDEEESIAKQESLKAPEKPTFCTEEDTTQYIFDGCMVQNNKVYVGKEYARDLSPEEIEQLKVFDGKMTVYQKWAQKQMQKQMKGIFGGSDFFSALFSDGTSDARGHEVSTTAEPEETAPEAPEAPKFCTAIY